MQFTVQIMSFDILPSDREFAQAAGRGVMNVVKAHLVRKDGRSSPEAGMRRTGYWGDAAASVSAEVDGNVAVVSIPKEGVALHYYGGTVRPTGGKKALAIPKSPRTQGKRAEEFDPKHEIMYLVWPKKSKTGTLRDRETGEILYLLTGSAKIKADDDVLPKDEEMYAGAQAAMEAIV